MKKFTFALLISTLLFTYIFTGCAASPESNPPAASPSPTKSSTPTNTPIPLPTSSPTITPTPLPQKPDGAQTFDLIRSLWTKTDDGVDFYYNPEMESWTTALNKRPIYLISAKNYTKDVASVLPTGYTSMKLYYYRMAGSEEPFVSVEEPSEYNNNWFGDTFNFSILILQPYCIVIPHRAIC